MKPGLWERVMERDGGCVLHRLEPGHVCRTVFGTEHPWNATDLCTIEHVKAELRMGKRAPDDMGFLVALCGAANNRPPTKVQRAAMRRYLEVMAA
jgi:hypothetical protein